MIDIRIKGLDQLSAGLDRVEKQLRYAASRTLNRLAQQHVIPAIKREMADSFDKPTPWTLNSVRQWGQATKDKPETRVDFKTTQGSTGTSADKYLRWQVHGGERRLKRFEVALRRVGALPDGYVTVAGAGAKLDAYGNVSAAQIVQLLSYFQAFDEAGKGFRMNATAATKAKQLKGTRSKLGAAYWVGRPGGRGALGIWQRVRIATGVWELLPVLLFVKWTRYEKRLDLEYTANLAVEKNLAAVFRDEFDKAMASAR